MKTEKRVGKISKPRTTEEREQIQSRFIGPASELEGRKWQRRWSKRPVNVKLERLTRAKCCAEWVLNSFYWTVDSMRWSEVGTICMRLNGRCVTISIVYLVVLDRCRLFSIRFCYFLKIEKYTNVIVQILACSNRTLHSLFFSFLHSHHRGPWLLNFFFGFSASVRSLQQRLQFGEFELSWKLWNDTAGQTATVCTNRTEKLLQSNEKKMKTLVILDGSINWLFLPALAPCAICVF